MSGRWILVWMMACAPILVVAQNGTPSSQTQDTATQSTTSQASSTRTAPAAALSAMAGMQENDVADTNSQLPRIPALLGGAGISPAFLSELEKSNYLRAGVNVGATYDDNPLLLSPSPGSNTSESIFPNLKIEESSSRVRWSLGYAGGLTVNQKITSENQGSHNLNFDSQFRLSPHVNLRVAENFSLTTGLFDTGAGTAIGAGGPNGSLITPLATQRSNTTTVETNYHFALNDLIGASGSYYDLHFSNQSTASQESGTQPLQLEGSQTASGSGFWLHRLFRDDWGGVSYRFDRITFNGGESRVHSFYAVDTVKFSGHITLSAFVGPQYSENQGLLAAGTPANGWSVAGGIEGGWQDLRTSLTGGYSRSVSDGGGVLGTVRLQNVHANFRREIVPGWAAGANVMYGKNQALVLTPVSNETAIHVTSVGAMLERNVGKSVGLRMGYTHDFQQQFLTNSSPELDASRNRFFITLSYQWAKPLGM